MRNQAFNGLGLESRVLDLARSALESGQAYFEVVSGKQASGKDTVAPIVLSELGYTDAAHLSYAMPLKDECDAIIALLRSRFSVDQHPTLTDQVRRAAAQSVAERFDIDIDQAAVLTADLLDAVRADETLNARSRTPLMRFVLQYLGTNIRRAQDEMYWVTRALRPAVEALSHGRSVYFTDARFPNEITLARALGAVAIRLDVSPEVQRARLLARDGIVPDPDSLNHESETALDAFEDFDVRLPNEGPLADVVGTIVSHLAPQHTAATA